jgi:MFS family permease
VAEDLKTAVVPEVEAPPAAVSGKVPRPFVVACFLSNFDRFAITPMLVAVAAGMHTKLSTVVLLASGYFFAYGCAQPLWGMLSDRYGRMRIVRLTLSVTAVCGVLSALSPTLATLVVLRIATGAFFGGVVPTSLTYVGDTVPPSMRQRALSDLQLALAIGTASATVVAGVVAQLVSWRLMFALPSFLAGDERVPLQGHPPLAGQAAGQRPAAALVLAGDGLRPGRGGGAAGLLHLPGAGAAAPGPERGRRRPGHRPLRGRHPGVLPDHEKGRDARPLVADHRGRGDGLRRVPDRRRLALRRRDRGGRGTAVALFVAALFIGSAIGSAFGAHLAGHSAYGELFAVAAVTAVPLTVVAAVTRRRYTPAGV